MLGRNIKSESKSTEMVIFIPLYGFSQVNMRNISQLTVKTGTSLPTLLFLMTYKGLLSLFVILLNSAYPGYHITLLLDSSSKLLHLGHLNSLYLKIPMAISLKGATSTVICPRLWKWKEEKCGMKTVCDYMLDDCVIKPYAQWGWTEVARPT